MTDLPLFHLTRPAQGREASGKPPLLLLLHGVGSHERDLFSLAPQLDPRFLILSLRGPLAREPGGYGWFDVTFTPNGPVINADQLDESRRRLIAFIGAAVAAYGADPARVYLLGFSQGAIISLSVALTEPRLIAGVVALSGRIPQQVLPGAVSPEETAGLPIFLAHGRADQVIPIGEARKAREVLERWRVALTYREYDAAHQITPDILGDASAWLGECL